MQIFANNPVLRLLGHRSASSNCCSSTSPRAVAVVLVEAAACIAEVLLLLTAAAFCFSLTNSVEKNNAYSTFDFSELMSVVIFCQVVWSWNKT
jgi:hypothetical protein